MDPGGARRQQVQPGADGAAEVDHTEAGPEPDPKARTLQAMSFSTHVMSLNTMALMHLGAIDGGMELPVDLEAAQHLIDTLAMLREKTHGNYPAGLMILSAVNEGLLTDFDTGLRIESRYMVSLLLDPVAEFNVRERLTHRGG